MTKIIYIWHDCFVVETSTTAIIFDYWKDVLTFPEMGNSNIAKENGTLPGFLTEIPREKPIYVVVSHHHKDHFNKDIFNWGQFHPDIRYIVSKDVARHVRYLLNPESTYSGIRPDLEKVTVLKPGESFEDHLLKVEAFGSTDIGNSYCITTREGETIFHAGDLNAWIWKDESTEKEVAAALRAFTEIVEEISSRHPKLDYVMFPVDSRIGTDYFTGARIFVREIAVARFFPMHFGLGETTREQLKYRLDAARTELYANTERGEYICLQAPYSSYANYSPRANNGSTPRNND